jgi:hypothetical protein
MDRQQENEIIDRGINAIADSDRRMDRVLRDIDALRADWVPPKPLRPTAAEQALARFGTAYAPSEDEQAAFDEANAQDPYDGGRLS